jgi:predicted component of viral defense system (DUF524 family)
MAFLRHLITSAAFEQAVDQILAIPHRRMVSERADTSTYRGLRSGKALATSLARGSERLTLPTGHPIYRVLSSAGVSTPTLPHNVRSYRRHETIDTLENRFVLFVLQEFRQTLADVAEILRPRSDLGSVRLSRELTVLLEALDRPLNSHFFRGIGRATTLPLGSPVLQRKPGYRELLQTWVQFNLAAHLKWTGGNDVYSAGKKDVAALYEYWCYFLLLKVVSKVVSFENPPAANLIDTTQSGLHLRLRAGRTLDLVGTHRRDGSEWHVRYSYNRTFSGVPPSSDGSYPRPGSWTRSMRPDYTISVWPAEHSEYEAELAERIVHIHFDAKYRIDSLVELFGKETELVDEEVVLRTNTRPKRDDLLKMHAYRDAIRRTHGSYVLYPGTANSDLNWVEFHELIPGLGAFAVRPGQEDIAKETLALFLNDILKQASRTLARTS